MLETSTSLGSASAATRAPVCTAIPVNVTAGELDLARVHAGADLEAERPHSFASIDSRSHGASRAVKRRQEAVAGRSHLTASIPLEHAPHSFVMTAEQAPPVFVAELTRPLRRPHDVGEQHRRKNSVDQRRAADAADEPARLVEHERVRGRVRPAEAVHQSGNLDQLRTLDPRGNVADFIA